MDTIKDFFQFQCKLVHEKINDYFESIPNSKLDKHSQIQGSILCNPKHNLCGWCAISSFILVNMLRDFSIKYVCFNQIYSDKSYEENHYAILCKIGKCLYLVDPTYGQFNGPYDQSILIEKIDSTKDINKYYKKTWLKNHDVALKKNNHKFRFWRTLENPIKFINFQKTHNKNSNQLDLSLGHDK
jgi:hypothetical protein